MGSSSGDLNDQSHSPETTRRGSIRASMESVPESPRGCDTKSCSLALREISALTHRWHDSFATTLHCHRKSPHPLPQGPIVPEKVRIRRNHPHLGHRNLPSNFIGFPDGASGMSVLRLQHQGVSEARSTPFPPLCSREIPAGRLVSFSPSD